MSGITKDAKEAARLALNDLSTFAHGMAEAENPDRFRWIGERVAKVRSALDSLPVLPEPLPGEAEAAVESMRVHVDAGQELEVHPSYDLSKAPVARLRFRFDMELEVDDVIVFGAVKDLTTGAVALMSIAGIIPLAKLDRRPLAFPLPEKEGGA